MTKKQRLKTRPAHLPESPKDVLEKVVNEPTAEFLEWKYDNIVEQRIVFRGINLLRTRMRFLIDHPDGYHTSEQVD